MSADLWRICHRVEWRTCLPIFYRTSALCHHILILKKNILICPENEENNFPSHLDPIAAQFKYILKFFTFSKKIYLFQPFGLLLNKSCFDFSYFRHCKHIIKDKNRQYMKPQRKLLDTELYRNLKSTYYNFMTTEISKI